MSLLKNFIPLICSNGSITAFSMLSKIAVRAGTFLIIAPMIGPVNQGTIVLVSTWAATILLIMGYGLQVRVLREAAINPCSSRCLVFGDLRAMAFLFVVAFIVSLFLALFFFSGQDRVLFLIFVFATAASIVGDYCSSALRALDKFKSEVIISVSTSILQMVFVVCSIVLYNDLIFLAIAIFLSRFIYSIVSLKYLLLSTASKLEAATSDLFFVLKSGFRFFVDGSLSVILNCVDVLLLGFLVDKLIVGYYSVGSKVVQMFLIVPWIVTNFLLPRLAKATTGDSFSLEFNRMLRWMTVFGAGASAGLLLIGPLITNFFMGGEYSALNGFWFPFSILVMVRFLEAGFGIGLTAKGAMGKRVAMQVFALFGIVFFGGFLTEFFGAIGLITAISFIYLCIANVYFHEMRTLVGIKIKKVVFVNLLFVFLLLFSFIDAVYY